MAAVVARIPRSTAGTSANAPRNFPTGVRAPSRMTARSTAPILATGARTAGSGHVADEPAPDLLGGPAPHAVSLAVANGPRQTHVAHGAHGAVGERQAGLL